MRKLGIAISRLGAKAIFSILVFVAFAACAAASIFMAKPYWEKPAGPFHGQVVLFGAYRDAQRDTSCILSIKPDGTDLKTLLTIKDKLQAIHSGRVSPDARSIAFTIMDGRIGKNQAWLLGEDGNHRMLLDDAFVMAWSPDGKTLACLNGVFGNWKSFFFDLESGKKREIPIPSQNHVNDWMHNNNVLCVMLGEPGKVFMHPKLGEYPLRQIGTIGSQGENPTLVTNDPSLDNLWARVSPDDSQIAHYQRKHFEGRVLESLVASDSHGKTSREILRYDELDPNLIDKRESPRPYWTQEGSACWASDGSEIACLISNSKTLGDLNPDTEKRLRYAIVFAASQGGFKRSIDLTTLGVSQPNDMDWVR